MATLSQQRLIEAREQLAEEDAVHAREYQSTSIPLLKDSELQRTWDELTEDMIPDLVEYLNLYASAKNAKPQNYVIDPMVDGVVAKGTWRNAFVRRVTSGGVTTLVQVLRKGYITSLVTNEKLDWSEARIAESRRVPGSAIYPSQPAEDYYRVSYPNVSPSHVLRILDDIDGLNPDDFSLFNGGAGGLHRLYTTYRLEDDGSATILLYLAEPEYGFYAYADFATQRQQDITYLWNVPKTMAQEIVNVYKAKGRSATATYNAADGLVDLVLRERNYTGITLIGERTGLNCDAEETSSFYWGIEDPSAYALPNPFAQGQSGRKEISTNGDGSYDVQIVLRQTQPRTYGEHLRSVSTLQESAEYIQLGIIEDSAIPDISSPVVGTTYRQELRIRDDCSKDVTTVQDRAVYASAGPTLSRRGALSFTETTEVRNDTDPIAAEFPVQGTIFQARSQLNEFGRYDGVRQRDTSYVANMDFASQRTALIRTTTTLYRNSETPMDAPWPDQGATNVVRQTVNEDGTYDSEWVYAESVPAVIPTPTVRAKLQESDEVVYRSSRTLMEMPLAQQGQVYRLQAQPNADGTYDGSLAVDESKEGALYTTWMTRNGIAAAWTWRNVSAIPSEIAALTDIYNDWGVSTNINVDGTYDVTLRKNPLNNLSSIVDWEAGHHVYWHFVNRMNRDIYVYDLRTNSTSAAEDHIKPGSALGGSYIMIGEDSGKSTDMKYLGWGRWFSRHVEMLGTTP